MYLFRDSFSAGILNFLCVCGGTSSPRTSASLNEFFASDKQVEKEQAEGCAGELSGQAKNGMRHFYSHPIGWHSVTWLRLTTREAQKPVFLTAKRP